MPDPVWSELKAEIRILAIAEPCLASYLHAVVLNHHKLKDSLSFILAEKLTTPHLSAMTMRETIDSVFCADSDILESMRLDLCAVRDRDPAAGGLSNPFLYYKGFHALQAYRVSHYLWCEGRQPLACYLQSRISSVFAVDIHPAARLGNGIFIDHGTSVVIGETAVIGNNVSMLHEVTLGGTGKEHGDRHPKVGNGVLLGAGAKILGKVVLGDGCKVGAGSVVLNDVPAHTTVAGVPAKVVGHPSFEEPALLMDQQFDLEYHI